MDINKESLIRLTASLYQITVLFPKKEPLRYKLRELANDVLNSFIRIENANNLKRGLLDSVDQICDNLDVMDGFFAIAKEQNWVVPDQLLSVWEGYNGIKEYLRKDLNREEVANHEVADLGMDIEVKSANDTKRDFNERQQKILEAIQEKGKVQVGEFKDVFPMVTKRTLRRDFWHLFKTGEIERIGEGNNTYYQLVGRT